METFTGTGNSLLSQQIASQTALDCAPFVADSFVARSILQKAIRRGEVGHAMSAAMTLLECDPDTLWRRLLVTCLEDIGIERTDLLTQIMIASTKTARSYIGPDIAIAQALIVQMCDSAKSQAANDLVCLSIHSRPIPECGVVEALSSILGDLTGAGSGIRAHEELLRRKFRGRVASEILELYLWAYRRTRLNLVPASLTLLAFVDSGRPRVLLGADAIPNWEWVVGVPSYSLDQYTRSGKAAIRSYCNRSSAWAKFAGPLAIEQTYAAAGELIFRVEGAVLANREACAISSSISERARNVGCFVPEQSVEAGYSVVRETLPLLNCLRRQFYKSG